MGNFKKQIQELITEHLSSFRKQMDQQLNMIQQNCIKKITNREIQRLQRSSVSYNKDKNDNLNPKFDNNITNKFNAFSIVNFIIVLLICLLLFCLYEMSHTKLRLDRMEAQLRKLLSNVRQIQRQIHKMQNQQIWIKQLISEIKKELVQLKDKQLQPNRANNSGDKSKNLQIIDPQNQIDETSHDYKRIGIASKLIIAHDWTANLFGKIRLSNKHKFTVIFTQLGRFSPSLGIVNDQYKNKPYLSNLPYWIYYKSDGTFYNGKQSGVVGSGFRQNQYVSLTVDYAKGTLSWRTGDKLIQQAQAPNIIGSSIGWVPYLFISKDAKMYIVE